MVTCTVINQCKDSFLLNRIPVPILFKISEICCVLNFFGVLRLTIYSKI